MWSLIDSNSKKQRTGVYSDISGATHTQVWKNHNKYWPVLAANSRQCGTLWAANS
jgi:hypothetical protein